jgi:SAM-dependent methyltransferase
MTKTHTIDTTTEPAGTEIDTAVDTAVETALETVLEAEALIDTFVDEYADAARYDFEYGTAGADLPFYLELAAATGGRVLDVATGTGRAALALAEAGYEVTAVDINGGMLECAAAKADAQELSERVTWVEQDARDLKIRGKFDLAVVAGNALQQFLGNEDRAAALKSIYRQLNAGGTLAFAVRFPHTAELARRVETPEIWHSYTDAAGSQVVVSGTQRYDAATQVMTHETYRQYAVDGTPASAPTTTAVRYALPQELRAALEAARFEVAAVYADFVRTSLTAETAATASALVFVARKPEAKKA